MLNKDELIAIAREQLPLPSDVKGGYYMVPILERPTPLTFSQQFGPTGEARYNRVVFVKEYVGYLCIGWKFDEIC
jgi:hypothetical protein